MGDNNDPAPDTSTSTSLMSSSMALVNVPEVLAKIEEKDIYSFLVELNQKNASPDKPDYFPTVVAACARDEVNGRTAIARLLPFFEEFGHPEYAIFEITHPPSSSSNDTSTNKNKILMDFNEDNCEPGLAGLLDASGSMDKVAYLIQHLIEQLDTVPIWSCFSTKVHIHNEPYITEQMGIYTGKKSCSMTMQCANPQNRRYYRFASLHGVSHQHMMEMISHRETEKDGSKKSLFRFQTWSANLFNLAWAMHYRNVPYVLLVIGDGEFDDIAELSDLLLQNKAAFSLCRKIIFVAAPHITALRVEELTNIFAQFAGMTEGCLFRMLQPAAKTIEAMNDLACEIKKETAVASLMKHIPGYRILANNEGPIYIPDTDRQGIVKAVSLCPNMGHVLARTIINVVSERSLADRVLYDPLFSKLYGALISLRFSENHMLRDVSEWLKTELSRVNIKILEAIRLSQGDLKEFHKQHRDLVSYLIDESKKDPTAFNRAEAELGELIKKEKANGSQIHHLKTMKSFHSNIIKNAIRQIGADDFRTDKSPELLQVLHSLFTSSDELEKDDKSIPFSLDSPSSIKLALGLMFKLHGCNDIFVKARPLLLVCLHLCYNLKVASVNDRDGIDASIALLSQEFLRTFRDYSILGLEKEADGNEYQIKEFYNWMNNPITMRFLLRANKDFGMIPSIDLVDVLKNFIKARAFLELLNGDSGTHGVTIGTSALIIPPNSLGFDFHLSEYRPTKVNDPRVLKHAGKKHCSMLRETQNNNNIPRRLMKTFVPEEHCAAKSYHSLIDEKCATGSNNVSGMLDMLLGVGLRMEPDGHIVCTTCPWTLIQLQRKKLDDGSLESWGIYWQRVQRFLINTLKLQHQDVLFSYRSRVEHVQREWKQKGLIAVFVEGFPREAELAFPVYGSNGELLPVDNEKLHPRSLLMSKSSVNTRFQATSSGKVQREIDHYNIHLPWRQILAIRGMPECLGLNPHVIELLMDKQQISGTKLKFDIAPELINRYDSTYDLPIGDENWKIHLEKNFYTEKFGVQVKGECDIRFGDENFKIIKDELSRQLENYMKVSLTLRGVVDQDTVAMCWICTEEERVGNKHFWVDLKCCGQALCLKCLDQSTRIDELPLRLFPSCPFCANALGREVLNRFYEEGDHGCGRGDTLSFLRTHVLHHNEEVANFHPFEEVRDMKKSYRFSLCRECKFVIPTKRDCAARVDDLPTLCAGCIKTNMPSELNVKDCPSCGQHIERIDGCNNVKCTCGQSICWVCGEGVEDHDSSHFVDGYFGNSCITTIKSAATSLTGHFYDVPRRRRRNRRERQR